MFDGDRLRSLMALRKLSQSELARRVGVSQASIYRLVAGDSYGSKHLHKIARELATTPAYLAGEIDDPDAGALPLPPLPRYQHVMLQAVLPSEPALAAAFEAILLASPRMSQSELAHELAKRLPTLLRVAAGALADPQSAADAAPAGDQAVLDDDRRVPRRASRT